MCEELEMASFQGIGGIAELQCRRHQPSEENFIVHVEQTYSQ